MLTEDSLLNSCFSGKFVIFNKCSKCTKLSVDSEDFLSLNLEAFTSNQVEHIKSLRKDFSVDTKEKKKGFGGLFKSMSRRV